MTVGKNFEKSVTCHQADLSSSNRLDFILKWVCICLKEIMEKMILKNNRLISNCIEIVHLFLPKRIQWMFCTQIVHTWHWQEKMQSNMKNNWSKWLFYSVETIFLSKMVHGQHLRDLLTNFKESPVLLLNTVNACIVAYTCSIRGSLQHLRFSYCVCKQFTYNLETIFSVISCVLGGPHAHLLTH